MTIEQAARAVLLECGVAQHMKGFRYLHTAIVMCYKDEELLEMVTKRLYPAVAKVHNTDYSRVERCMRSARASCKSNHKSNSAFICAAVWFLKQLDEPPV